MRNTITAAITASFWAASVMCMAVMNTISNTPRPPGACEASATENEARKIASTGMKPGFMASGRAK